MKPGAGGAPVGATAKPTFEAPGSHGRDSSAASGKPSLLEELLFCGYQTRFLETELREISAHEDLPPQARAIRTDPRTVAIAYAMEQRVDGTGDVCAPGPAAPGPNLAFGGTPLEFLRHMTGRGTGPNHGRGGGLGWTDMRHGLIGDAGPPGTMTQVMAGAALAFKKRKEPRAALVFEKASAADSGGWHEGINFGAAQRLPLIVVMTDTEGPSEAGSGRPIHFGHPAEAYGLQLLTFSLEPLSRLLELVGEARSRAIAAEGPVLIRLLPVGDWDARWGSLDDLVQECRTKDLVSGSTLDQLEGRAQRDVEHAVRRLAREPGPEVGEALGPVWTDAPRIPAWTRQDPVSPGAQTPLERRGGPVVT